MLPPELVRTWVRVHERDIGKIIAFVDLETAPPGENREILELLEDGTFIADAQSADGETIQIIYGEWRAELNDRLLLLKPTGPHNYIVWEWSVDDDLLLLAEAVLE